MASNAANNAVILEVLNRHLKWEPHQRAEITIKKAKHEITDSELDFLIRDLSSPLVAARLILTLRDISNPEEEARQGPTELLLAAHIITSSDPDPSSSPYTSVILDDTHGGASQSPGPTSPTTAPPQRASTIPTYHPCCSYSAGRPLLKDTYREYIATFMAPPPTALSALPRYLHEPVTHNQRALDIPQYHNLVETVRESIPDISAEIVDLVSYDQGGVIAARLEFRGTLVAPFAGVEPPADGGGGLPVRIGEIVFYWFEAGRISEVVSLVDLGGMAGDK